MIENNKEIIVLGSTGSVGLQALDVARSHGYKVSAISANRNIKELESQAREFNVDYCAVADKEAAKELKIKLADTKTQVLSSEEGICEMVKAARADVVVNSIIGQAGLYPTLAVIDSGKRLALANKESVVVAGDIVMRSAKEKNVEILPVDSEHCAIFQCLKCGEKKEVKNIILTASGGPFFNRSRDELQKITVDEALAHPTWKMGHKITIDSATLMNKGFEFIEAVHLFDVSPEAVKVIIHRESIIHSMVEYIDNSVIAQLSVPDMRSCVQYAANYPDRKSAVIDELDLVKMSHLSFYEPDLKNFSLLQCAMDAIKKGGALPAVLNASNEVAVAAFLSGEISFCAIMDIVQAVVDEFSGIASGARSLEEILNYDAEARLRTRKIILSHK